MSTRLATALFLDIVGSTHLAADLGDDRWRAVLARFRGIVRSDLHRYGGHEEDTAGDGFFATFDQPASAIRGATAIVRDVQAIGIDVRCGIHTGEVGSVDRRPGGMAVVIAARAMAIADAAEILCTTTVRDLVVGLDIAFDEGATYELKGVPGKWELVRVARAPEPVPVRLVEEETRSRLASVQPVQARRRRTAIVGATSFVIVAVIATSVLVVQRRAPPPMAVPPPALLRIDPHTDSIVQTMGVRPDDLNSILAAADGTLWQRSGDVLIGRRMTDGAETNRIETDPLAIRRFDAVFGFGSAWTYSDGGYPYAMQKNKIEVTRYDQVSERATHFKVPGSVMRNQYANGFRSFLPGPDGIWYLSGNDRRLRLIEPSNRIRSWSTGAWLRRSPRPGPAAPDRDVGLALRAVRERTPSLRHEDAPSGQPDGQRGWGLSGRGDRTS